VVKIHFGEGRLDIEVQDAGDGFDLEGVQADYASRGSLGLLNMRERAQACGGDFILRSKPGEGTTVFLSVPLE
jgi:signal transduction histidine kinase